MAKYPLTSFIREKSPTIFMINWTPLINFLHETGKNALVVLVIRRKKKIIPVGKSEFFFKKIIILKTFVNALTFSINEIGNFFVLFYSFFLHFCFSSYLLASVLY